MSNTLHKDETYNLWNPFTNMDDFLSYIEIGPLIITRGEGAYVYNDYGKRFINGSSSLWNVAIGHGRKELVEAAANQMSELAYSSCFRQTHPRAIELAKRLIDITSGRYQHVYLGSNGSEVVETSIKISRQYHYQSPSIEDRKRFKIISLQGSYHGVSYGAMSTSGCKDYNEKYGPLLSGFVQIDPPYCYRCPYGESNYPECGLKCAKELENTILKEGPETISAFILEPVMGVFGMVSPPKEYFKIIGEICKKYGILIIADEVTTGFGRTGKLFATNDWEITPDILCLGKAISSGYLPLAATLVTEKIYHRFKGSNNQLDTGSTASGHPVCCAVGLANIDIIINENLPENSFKVGSYLFLKLKELENKHNIIGNIRGKGLMIAIELVKDKETKEGLDNKKMFEIIADIASLGMVVYYNKNYIGLLPPLIIDKAIVNEMIVILDKALKIGKSSSFKKKARLMKELISSKIQKGI